MQRPRAALAALAAALALLAAAAIFLVQRAHGTVLQISDWKTGEIYVQAPAKAGGKIFFGWVHSWEKIPWHEYYHIAENGDLILDTIAFPAFGAGIPENKGKKVRIEDGMIYMEDIGQVFHEFTWLNSHFAVRDIRLDGALIARGNTLPEHTRLNLRIITKKGRFGHGTRQH